jgi:hypothetical protein
MTSASHHQDNPEQKDAINYKSSTTLMRRHKNENSKKSENKMKKTNEVM